MSKKTKHKPGKLGRNDLCFCGSGVKYKKCCLPKGLTLLRPAAELPPEVLEHFQQVQARDAELQSKGIYIGFPNTIRGFKGKSFMAVGNKLMYHNNPDATFHQLILQNLSLTLGEEWWKAEEAKRPAERHFIMRGYDDLKKPLRPEQRPSQANPKLRSFLPTGNVQALMSLAFDVYVLTHKGFLPEDWLERLRSRDQYQGVRYEIAVASIFVRMGCNLEFYDEKTKSKHGEFIATHTETGNRVAVEAKSRQRPGVLHAAGEPNLRKAMLGDVTKLFNKALKKDTEDLPYIVFIDVNSPSEVDEKTVETRWFADIRKMIGDRGEAAPENPDPYTALFVTNYSPHYRGDEVRPAGGMCLVASVYPMQPLADGIHGVFLGKLNQAVNGYGFVPLF